MCFHAAEPHVRKEKWSRIKVCFCEKMHTKTHFDTTLIKFLTWDKVGRAEVFSVAKTFFSSRRLSAFRSSSISRFASFSCDKCSRNSRFCTSTRCSNDSKSEFSMDFLSLCCEISRVCRSVRNLEIICNFFQIIQKYFCMSML